VNWEGTEKEAGLPSPVSVQVWVRDGKREEHLGMADKPAT
jgi:hypothetical protein